jgi:hypothetical protein
MYKATKHDIENALQVLDARSHQKMLCFQEELANTDTEIK